MLPLLRPLADVGLVLFMFLVGLELDHRQLRGQGRRAIAISHASIVLPFGLGVALGFALHPTLGGAAGALPFALFTGAAMAVTAFPVLARILQDTGLAQTKLGTTVLAAAAVDDVTAWCVLVAVLAVAGGTGMASVAIALGGAVLFGAVMWWVVRPLLARAGGVPIPVAIGIALGAAWVTELLGVHAIFGAFVAGAAMPRDDGARLLVADRLESVVGALLLPVFFVIVGLSTRIGLVDTPQLWAVAALVLAVATVGKVGGAGLAARFTGSTWHESAVIGILMNTRGLTEIVILTVGLGATSSARRCSRSWCSWRSSPPTPLCPSSGPSPRGRLRQGEARVRIDPSA